MGMRCFKKGAYWLVHGYVFLRRIQDKVVLGSLSVASMVTCGDCSFIAVQWVGSIAWGGGRDWHIGGSATFSFGI